MCGIAGILELSGDREITPEQLVRMATVITHRGPDEQGIFRNGAVGLAARRLSIVDLADGQQPVTNEDGSVVAVFNGEIYDHERLRARLIEEGHVFRSRCDSEVLVHLWERDREGMLEHVRGQFAFAVYDQRRRTVLLARDRVGICPLHWTRVGNTIVFGSEIKSILASGLIRAEMDPAGLDSIFTYFAMPTRRTMFRGVQQVLPGGRLFIDLERGQVREGSYWDLDFPDAGQERQPKSENELVDEFESVFRAAVDRRLRADVPVVSYLSGGVDSATVCAVAAKVHGTAPRAFTIKVCSKSYDEADAARRIADGIGAHQSVVNADSESLQSVYPKVIQAAESPVVDTACAALYLLAAEVRRQGYKVVLSGEGADEALAGYPWFKVNRLFNGAGRFSSFVGDFARRSSIRVSAPTFPWKDHLSARQKLGGKLAQVDLYSLVSSGRRRFFTADFLSELNGHQAIEDMVLNHDRMRHWSPLNQSIYLGYKTILPGLLLNHKGDRVAMANSVEVRYPFLDEEVIAFCCSIAPDWKLRGILRDKVVLRRAASRYLPTEVADRPKAMFRAPFGQTFFGNPAPWVDQLLSPESLARTNCFDPQAVQSARKQLLGVIPWPGRRTFLEMGLTAVLATQLWSHSYLGGQLCDLPAWEPRIPDEDLLLETAQGIHG